MGKAIVDVTEDVIDQVALADEVPDDNDDDEGEDKANADVLVDELVVNVMGLNDDGKPEADANGHYFVELDGLFRFRINETTNDEQTVEFTSSMFKGKKDDLAGAVKLAIENVARRAFKRTWDVIDPPPVKIKRTRESLSAQLAERELEATIRDRQLAIVMENAMKGIPPTDIDWTAAGVPAPDFLAAAE
jgi:hypothetical protein